MIIFFNIWILIKINKKGKGINATVYEYYRKENKKEKYAVKTFKADLFLDNISQEADKMINEIKLL